VPYESLVLIWLYGVVFICSTFLLLSFGRVLWQEGSRCHWNLFERRENPSKWWRRIGFGMCWRNPTWCIALGMILQSGGLWLIGLNRVLDGFNRVAIAGSEPILMMIGMINLAFGKFVFEWAATVRRRRFEWRLFLGVQVVWFAAVLWLIV
jgi:hypothetical protein